MLVVLASCGVDRLPASAPEREQTVFTAGCSSDDTCPAGMVCEGCTGPGDATCVPGCRVDAQCPARHVCRGPVACTSCPCAPGWCVLDPCRDEDGDGFAFTSDPSLSCPGKQKGDCNDGNGRQHPGATELCANSIDDDCDGKTDRNDESCQQCTSDSLRCNDAWDCASGGQLGTVQCVSGCCQSCPALESVRCGANEVAVGGGFDATTTCRVAMVCIEWALCANQRYEPQCGVDFATYRNPCTAAAAKTTVLHLGGCQWGEGRPCETTPIGARGPCESGQVCRLDGAAGKRCTASGTCVTAADCPAGLDEPTCDGGTAAWSCEERRCLVRCS